MPPPQAHLCRARRGTRWRCCPCTSRGASWCRPCAATASGLTSPCHPPLPTPHVRHCFPERMGDPEGPEWCTYREKVICFIALRVAIARLFLITSKTGFSFQKKKNTRDVPV